MRALYYQCSAGISGDMHLGAMVDLGVPEATLREGLARLPCAAEFSVEFERASKQGIVGTRARIKDLGNPSGGHRQHRRYSDIVGLIKDARLAPGVEAKALAVFERIAVAEAKIHDIPVDRVHFHEVGAVDSIVDVVGAAICLDALAVERVFCDRVEVGSGFVDCAHGRLPVPAPATQEILAGVPCSYGGVQGEATTPTGAAILKMAVDSFAPPQGFAPSAIGYGVGMRDFDIPNVLRMVVGECQTEAAAGGAHRKIEANIDDMSPEAYEPLIDHLLAAGASDVYVTPIVMKKSRPAISLTVLCEAERVDALADMVLNRSTTIGLRVLPFEKRVLPREVQTVETRLGAVRVKVVTQPDGQRRWKSEFEDVRRLADASGLDYLQAKAAVDRDVAEAFAAQRTATP